ncbi:MAG TPA: delta-60 repeat domain-containing protein, partial [Spirochaetota bacterium]|nr:delta-60 repeat domain-containing protein [Spirochaetota bacterium]
MMRTITKRLFYFIPALVISLCAGCGDLYNDILDSEKLLVLNITSNPAETEEQENENLTPLVPPTNGLVQAIAVAGDTVYIGGSFTRVGGYSYGAIIDPVTGDIPAGVTPPIINGPVYTSIPDGTGGWYIGGAFTTVNGQARRGIARINGDGSLNEWDLTCIGKCPYYISDGYLMAKNNNTIFIVSIPRIYAGMMRQGISAVDIKTKELL